MNSTIFALTIGVRNAVEMTVFQTSPLPRGILFEEVSLEVAQLVLATLLGMFLGLEREWSQKSAGIRTFALISLLGAILTIINRPLVVAMGSLLVVAMGILLAVRNLQRGNDDGGLSLTTSASLFVAFAVGILVSSGYVIESVVVSLLSSLLLVLKRELHEFAWGLTKDEMRSATEFAIISFVVYPLLPNESFGPWNAIEPQIIWLLVIAVSGIGLVNYILVKKYQGRGVVATGFFGGLVNSTAVIAEMSQRAKTQPTLKDLAVGAILIANAAMAFRNAIVVVAFIPTTIFSVGIPLGVITLTGIVLSWHVSDWRQDIETELTSPFSLRNALVFGGLFLIVLVVSAGAQALFGSTGFLTTAFLSGFVSSGTATATAITLVATGQISEDLAVTGVLAGTVASILVKVGFAVSMDKRLVKPVIITNGILIGVGLLAGGIVVMM